MIWSNLIYHFDSSTQLLSIKILQGASSSPDSLLFALIKTPFSSVQISAKKSLNKNGHIPFKVMNQ